MRRISGVIAAFVGGVAALCSMSAGAAPARQGVRLDPVQPASPESPFARAEGPHTPIPDAAEYALGTGIEYASRPLQAVGVDASGGEHPLADLVDHALFLRIAGSLAPTSWLTFDANVPIGVFVSGKDELAAVYGGERAAPPASSSGLGDLRFGAHVRAVDTESFDLLLGGRIWAPIGSASAYLSDRRFRGEIDFGAAGELGSLLYGATLSVSPGLFLGRDGDRAALALAAHALPVSAFSLGVEPTIALFQDVGADGAASIGLLIEPLAAMRLRLGGLRLGLAAGPVFGGVAGAGEFRGLFNLAYVGSGKPEARPNAPEKLPDRDLDGVPDPADACPDEAGPESREPGQSGCPAVDGDADGVRDTEDACPDRAGVKHPDAKANGCPDGDNDLIPDPLDSCAKEPGAEPFGCPKYARLKGNRFVITPPIEFTDRGLSKKGKAAIEEVAATMRANPKIEQVSFGIGTRGATAKAADGWAKAILLVLRAGNLDPNRYEVVLRDEMKGGRVEIRIIR